MFKRFDVIRAARRAMGQVTLAALIAVGSSASADAQDPNYVLTVGSATTAAGGLAQLPITLDSSGGGDIQGWSFGICFDTEAATVTNLSLGSTALTVNDGEAPEFQMLNLEPGGWTMGVVICITACTILPPGSGYELAIGEYQALTAEGTSIEFCPCSNIGTPPINAVVVVNGQSIQPVMNCGTIDVVPLSPFIRADANDDGFVDLSDGIWLLNYLFQGGPLKPCLAAADSNGDGDLDTADAITTIFYIFAGGPPPPAPFPTCGFMPNQGLTDCESYASCP